jgi:hypothetical protein
MPRHARFPLAVVLALSACGNNSVLVDGKGTVRVLADLELPADASAATAAVRGELDKHSIGVALVAFDAAAAWAGIAATTPATTAKQGMRITIAAAPTPEEKLDREVRLVDETGASVAVDFALLHIEGIALPERVPLGTRVCTFETRDGLPRAAAGDLVVAMLRSQHAAVLDPRPATDACHPIGFLRFDGKPRHVRAEHEVRAAAGRYAQLHLTTRDAAGDAAAWQRHFDELLQLGCRAIVVSTDDPASLEAGRQRADARKVALLALDPNLAAVHAHCCLSVDQATLGRAAAEQLRAAMPGGAAVVLARTSGNPLAATRLAAFAEALGLKRP